MSQNTLIGHTVVGHRIEGLLGEGGMGVVYRTVSAAAVTCSFPVPVYAAGKPFLVRIAARTSQDSRVVTARGRVAAASPPPPQSPQPPTPQPPPPPPTQTSRVRQ